MPYSDRDIQKSFQRDYYLRNKGSYKDSNTRIRKQRKEWFDRIMKGCSCSCCPESSLVALDFHHVDHKTKEDSVSRLFNDKRRLDRIIAEMMKCVVLCANCHRKHHGGLLHLDDTKLFEPPANWREIWEEIGQDGEIRTRGLRVPDTAL